MPLPENIINTSSLLPDALICADGCDRPVALRRCQFSPARTSQAGESCILPIDFDIKVKPYSLITARERALPPSARLLYDLILEESSSLIRLSASPAHSFGGMLAMLNARLRSGGRHVVRAIDVSNPFWSG